MCSLLETAPVTDLQVEPGAKLTLANQPQHPYGRFFDGESLQYVVGRPGQQGVGVVS